MSCAELLRLADDVRRNAYVPYSDFAVGAAMLTADGTVFCGCNVENASYSATCCAERAALFSAVAAGHRDFRAIAVVGGRAGQAPEQVCPPCGVCRQVLSELCGAELSVYLTDGRTERCLTLGALLPLAFGAASMQEREART